MPSKHFGKLTETERREITLVRKMMRLTNARGRHIYSFANIREVSIKTWRKAANDEIALNSEIVAILLLTVV